MSRLLTDVADLEGYAEPCTAQMDLDTLHTGIACEYAGVMQNSTHREEISNTFSVHNSGDGQNNNYRVT